MPVAVACPKCKKKYTLPDKLLGKPVKCTACETQFKTPGPKTAGQSQKKAVDPPKQAAAIKKAQIRAQRQAAELKKLGVEGAIQKEPGVFAGMGQMRGTPDPLSNHVIDDAGFLDVATATKQVEDSGDSDDPMAQMFVNPALGPKKKKNQTVTNSKNKKQVSWQKQPWFLLSVVFVPLFAISIVLTLTELVPANVAGMVAMISCGLFGLVGIIVGIWGLVLVNEESNGLQVVLCLFIPFYILYFIATHWEAMKYYAFALIATVLITPLGIAAITVAGVMAEFD